MGDLLFDPAIRDLVIENGDFVFTDNPSVQNGAVIRDAHCFSINNPIFGIGLQRIINAPLATINFEMNRWKTQCKNDGATKATFTAAIVNSQATVNNDISYV